MFKQCRRFALLQSVIIGLLALGRVICWGQTGGRITVQVDRPGIHVSPSFFGLMTEEINHSYDGGLYAELVANRNLMATPPDRFAWHAIGAEGSSTLAVESCDLGTGFPAGKCLRVDVHPGSPSVLGAGAANEGYWGVPILSHQEYRLSLFLRVSEKLHSPIQVSLAAADHVYAQATLPPSGLGWQRLSVKLRTPRLATNLLGELRFSTPGAGTFWLTQVSLFPPTYRNRANGNRVDLMQTLAGLHPSFLRLPGGNYLEGDTIEKRFDWKQTIGDPAKRPGHWGPWGYRSTDGLGLLEFLEWCEDLHMKPLLAVYAGYSLGGEFVKPGPDLEPFVQDALDEIEFVSGATNTKWGGERARLGHPKPFPLDDVEIGNEDGFDRSTSYDGRFAQYAGAIRAKYPSLKLIATSAVTSVKPDMVDDHYYRSAAEMERDSGHYDGYDRKGPKIFVGEWASVEGRPTPNLRAALGDAAWMMGLERNSDVVVMESYAPLLVNVNPGAAQWPTNLIGYDALHVFGSPSYLVQSLFAEQTGDRELPVSLHIPTPTKAEIPPSGRVGVGTWDTSAEFREARVESGGVLLSRSHLEAGANGTDDWSLGRGNWSADGIAIKQSGLDEDTRALRGEKGWTDYTFSVQAQKQSGAEGFMVYFHYKDDQNFIRWNVGGWQNTRTNLQQCEDGDLRELGDSVPVTIDSDRWYRVRIEVTGRHIKCYLDGRLIQEADEARRTPPPPVYASASLVSRTHDVILKVVNVSGSAERIKTDLTGIATSIKRANAWEISGEPDAVNTVDEPNRIKRQKTSVEIKGSSIDHVFPPYSITVIRIRS